MILMRPLKMSFCGDMASRGLLNVLIYFTYFTPSICRHDLTLHLYLRYIVIFGPFWSPATIHYICNVMSSLPIIGNNTLQIIEYQVHSVLDDQIIATINMYYNYYVPFVGRSNAGDQFGSVRRWCWAI